MKKSDKIFAAVSHPALHSVSRCDREHLSPLGSIASHQKRTHTAVSRSSIGKASASDVVTRPNAEPCPRTSALQMGRPIYGTSNASIDSIEILNQSSEFFNRSSTVLFWEVMPPSEKPYLNFVIDPELLKRLDDFRFQNRFATRAAAIKWLLTWALDQAPRVHVAE